MGRVSDRAPNTHSATARHSSLTPLLPLQVEHFISRVFDVARPFSSFLGTGFAVENRPSEPQAAHAMAEYLRNRASRKEPFLTTVSEFHLLCFLTNMLDMSADMPALCGKVREQSGDDLDGFQMMIRCYAGLD